MVSLAYSQYNNRETGVGLNKFHVFVLHSFIFGTTYNLLSRYFYTLFRYCRPISFTSQDIKQAIVVIRPTKRVPRMACCIGGSKMLQPTPDQCRLQGPLGWLQQYWK